MSDRRFTFNSHEPRIYDNVAQSMSTVEHHSDSPDIDRLVPLGFPVHLAIHSIVNAKPVTSRDYCQPHIHVHFDELATLVSHDSLTYDVVLDSSTFVVSAPSSVWIPAGTRHAMNVKSGKGFLFCLRLPVGQWSQE
jgi:hypothetical protein